MIVAVPSKGRAGDTTTQKVIPSCVFFVPESEVHQYEKVYPNVVGVPNSIKGITPTRNWILENTDDERVVTFITFADGVISERNGIGVESWDYTDEEKEEFNRRMKIKINELLESKVCDGKQQEKEESRG